MKIHSAGAKLTTSISRPAVMPARDNTILSTPAMKWATRIESAMQTSLASPVRS